MGLFDIVREKAAELLSGAGDKVSELTGTELPGADAADQLTQSAENVTDTAQDLGDTATGAAQDFTDSASEAIDPRGREE